MAHPASQSYFCQDLPTTPLANCGKILVTGASGYIGSRLVNELLQRGYPVRLMVRGRVEVYRKRWPETEIVIADAFNYDQIKKALEGIHIAYYLIHSLNLGPKSFESADETAAINFRKAAEENGVRRLIYLGGLGEIGDHLSHHLSSRTDVAIRLMMGKISVATLRAAVILGAGGSSHEIIHHLVKKLPVILPPPWAKKKCQPIALRDLIKYLVGVLETPQAAEGYFDVGGSDVLTYEEMLRTFSEILGRKVVFINSPINAVSLYSYLASLITPTSYSVIRCLFESLQNEVVCLDDSIRNLIPFKPMTYKEAILEAMEQEKEIINTSNR